MSPCSPGQRWGLCSLRCCEQCVDLIRPLSPPAACSPCSLSSSRRESDLLTPFLGLTSGPSLAWCCRTRECRALSLCLCVAQPPVWLSVLTVLLLPNALCAWLALLLPENCSGALFTQPPGSHNRTSDFSCSLSLRAALTHLVAESSPALEGDANATFDTVLCLLLRLLALPLCSRHHHGVQCSSLQTTLAVDVSSSSSSSSSSRRASLSLRTGLPGPSTVGSLTSGQGLLEDGVRTMISSCAFS
ncbi:uncharacterized protein LOC104861299 [Fukomys damarensis]|uniref:uncharacterized protein LOC104861299 n=1 Tax=Fukomys damarensis TaxID=885580 RepID=UPI00054021CE|nr:uncharacterized protein LOC104861299 [Fukomys damarensis]